jgi:HAD superfamily hydrolase (TIGR01458 family)
MTIDGVLLDLAGVVHDGPHIIPGAPEAIDALRQSGLPLRFVTNTTRMTRAGILGRLSVLGLSISEEELFTPVEAAKTWLRRTGRSPVLVVHENIKREFDGIAGPEKAVIVGDAGEGFDYDSLNHAFRELLDGADLVALAKNRSFKDDAGNLSLDAGAFVAALEYASGKEALIVGKPSSEFYAMALASAGCPAPDAAMVGDDAEADVAGALAVGIGSALLVRTGKYRPGDESRFTPAPTGVVDDLPAAADWILKHR